MNAWHGMAAVDMGDIPDTAINSTLVPFHFDPRENSARHGRQTNAGRGNASLRSYAPRRAATHLYQHGIGGNYRYLRAELAVELFFSAQDFTAQ
jgi:hypothetical protein